MLDAVIATAAYGGAFLAAGAEQNALAGLLLLSAAVLLYFFYERKSGMILDPAALFSLAWLGGCGLSAFKLSRLQTDWLPETWLCFYLIFMGFALGRLCFLRFFAAHGTHAQATRLQTKKEVLSEGAVPDASCISARRLCRAIYVLTLASVCAFCFEAIYLGYIPLFTVDTPHAYSYFHVSGVHYVTVSCVLVPALVWLAYIEGRAQFAFKQRAGLFACLLVSFLIPLLCVSRFQLIFAVALLVFTCLLRLNPQPKAFLRGKRPLLLLLAVLALLVCYLLLTVARAHSVSYLNGIFEMKNQATPIWFTQPYMYVANNFDNFNCLVRDLPTHTHGLRMLFPLFALTGLKFLTPALVSFPLYVTKTELTTVTLFYDAYYDFGVVGVFLFAFFLGACMAALAFFLQTVYCGDRKQNEVNPVSFLIAAQLCFYCLFAFFTTWYSNPATWFYLAVSLIVYGYVGRRREICCIT